MIQPNFILTEKNIEDFAIKGFVKLKGFLSEKAISQIDKQLDQQLGSNEPTGWYGDVFNRMKYDLGNNSQDILDLFQDNAFRSILANLTQHSLLFTQGIGFELRKNQDTGLAWHVETVSFSFHQMQDFACTMWIPLTNISNDGQGGGLSYVPKNVFSGEFIFQYREMLSSYLKNIQKQGKPVTADTASHLKSFIPKSKEMSSILDDQAVSEDFEVGDIFLFDKFVFHRSCQLSEGPIDIRRAYAMRFVDYHSKYDLSRVQTSAFFRELLNYNPSSFALEVCQFDGDAIIDSPLFDETRNKRVILHERDLA